MGQNNLKNSTRPVNFGMLLLSAAVMIFMVRLTIASDLDSIKVAAEQGDAEAQVSLGSMYDTGEGIAQNHTEAVRWFRMAAEQGLANAQFKLGIMYSDGRGVPKNDAEAVRWIRKAAEQGDVIAQVKLGYTYQTAEGIPKDYVQAYVWMSIAAAQGHEWAKSNLNTIAKKMTTADIAQAQELSLEYWEAYGPNRASSE